MEKVSADTIAQLTITYAHTTTTPGKPPSVEKMISDIRTNLEQRIKYLAASMQNEPENIVSAFRISHAKTAAKLKRLDQIVNNLPKGFRLVPVFYSKISQEENNRTQTQYSQLRADFMRYLAQNHATELSALGIAQQGIDRMKAGDNPGAGKNCNLNIDHIIERSGGGLASLTKAVDPLLPRGSGATYLVNHFSNFIFLPVAIHDVKNELNSMQGTDQLQPGQGKWVLMLVPEATPGYSGFVAQPQTSWQDNKPAPLPKGPRNPLQAAASEVRRINNILNNPKHDPAIVPSALESLANTLQAAFNDATRPHQSLNSFTNLYKSQRMEAVRAKIENLPATQTAQMRETIKSIDDTLRDRFKIHAANNNAPVSAPKNNYPPQNQKKLTKAEKRQQRRQNKGH